MTWRKKHKKIIKNDKDSVETRITERRIVIMTQNSTVDLRNRLIAVMIQKLGKIDNTVV